MPPGLHHPQRLRPHNGPAVADRWGIVLLGAPAVRLGERPEQALERKAAALLAYVALEGPTPRATLAGLLWPAVVESRARNNLRQLLHRLRRFHDLLAAANEVRLGDADADVTELRSLQDAGDSHAIAERWGSEAPVLLRGQELDDCPDMAEWLEAERARLSEAVTRAVEAEAERFEATGDVGRALEQAQRLLTLDPLSESAYRRAMRLHYLAGDRAQALDTYHRCQAVLHDTFAVDPLPDTVELARAIDAGTVERVPASEPRALPVTLRRPPRLVGRAAAWERLELAWDRVRTIVVTGEPGVGKTRLLQDFLRSKGDVIMSKGLPGERNVPYAAIARRLGDILHAQPELAAEPWVRTELARILPGQFEPPAGQEPIAGEPQKLRLFEAIATVVDRALQTRVALLNDDLHLWDAASFELGAYFISRFADSHARSLSTARPDELAPEHLREVERAADAGLAEIIELAPLDADQLGELIDDVGGGDGPPPGEVFQLSGGNPFYALEFLRNRWAAAIEGDDSGVADSGAGVLEARLRRLSGTAHDLLRVRAFSGTFFSLELAGAVLELPAAAVRDALTELHRQRLLSDDHEAHELVYEAVTRRTPPEASRLWHRRVAVHLEAFGAGAAAVARQYLAAWEPAAAYPFLLRAGADAQAVHALEDARSWYLRALWAAPGERQQADALLRLDDAGGQHLSLEQAEGVLNEIQRLAVALQEPVLLVEAALRRARWLTRKGDHVMATRLANEALTDAGRLDDGELAERARLTLGDLAYLGGRYAEAQARFLEATQAGRDDRRLRAFQRLGALEGIRGDVSAAAEHHQQALALARKLNDLPLVATLLNSVGADSERMGAFPEATEAFARAAEVAARIGDRRTAAIALSNAGLTHTELGDLASALRSAERALQAARPLGFDRSVAMAHFVHGYALRRLGRPAPARDALGEAMRVRQAANDVRGALIARFNLSVMELEAAAPDGRGAASRSAADRAEAILAEVEALGIPQFLAWCLVELAFLEPDAGVAQARVAHALTLEQGEHLRLAASAAALRAAMLAGDASETRRRRQSLLDHLDGRAYLETSLAHLLLASAAGSRAAREKHEAKAARRIEEEVGRLGPDAAGSRRAYLETRLPPRG